MDGVNLKAGLRASEVLFEVLDAARRAHPDAFAGLRWPDSKGAFRKGFADALIAFERRRLASPERAEIANSIVEASQRAMVFADDAGDETPLTDYLLGSAEPLRTETVSLQGSPGLVPELTFRGEHHRGEGVLDLARDWFERHWMTESAYRGLEWTLRQSLDSASGRTDLSGQKLVTLGGGAELSPTRAMLRAGGDVLYLDVRDPGDEILKDPRVSGTLSYVPGGANLLTQPREIAATIQRFAGNDPVHIGMYAYSGGAAQEWRLTASMNAIVRSLPRGLVRSVVLLISPTTPGTVSELDARAADERRKAWLAPLGIGRSPAAFGQSGELPNRVSHSVISLQGVAYQAAQYIGKMMAAEVYAIYGTPNSGGEGLPISAPVAPITRTASLSHPLFNAGFEGAELFGVLVSEPQATRVMCSLLAFQDLLNPESPSRNPKLSAPERVRAVMGEQIHGGVFAQPHAFERMVILGAVAGLARKPELIAPAVRFLLGRG